MSADDAIERIIGRFGKYQIWMLVLITVGRFPAEFQLTNVVFLLPNVEYVCMDEEAYNISNHCPCNNPKYDQSTIVSSVTSEWNLICNNSSLASFAQSMLQVGILAGSLLYGYISDRYGRKIAVLLALFSEALFGTISGLVPEFWMFMISRFLIGTGLGGTMLCCYVLLIELSGKSFRPYLTGLIELAYVFGYLALAVIAIYVREWRLLQIVTSAPWLIVFIFYWIIPESPRWLITVKRKKEAVDVLTKIARINNRPILNIESIVSAFEKASMTDDQQQYGSYIDLFKTAKMRLYMIVMALIWLCCSHTFFGINQYIGLLQGNLYLNVIMSAITLIPGLILVVVACLYCGRRITTVCSFCVTALSLLVFLIIPDQRQWASLAFAIIGQTAAYIAFVQIYLYACEIFPTVVRNSAMGFASVFARFGGFIAPFVVNIGVEWASITVFSGLAFLAAILCFLLPETKDVVLPNSIKQTEKTPIDP